MKKLITATAVCCVFLLGILFWMGERGFAPHSGTYLEAGNGSHLIVVGNSPIVMSAKNVSFDKLDSGDRIFILHDGVEESYPARTGVYFLMKIGKNGSVTESVLQQLADLGWQIDNPPIDRINEG